MIILFLFLFFLYPEILTIYNDEGISGDNIYTWNDGGADYDGSSQDLESVPEGFKCFKTTATSGSYAGWGVFYNTEQDFSEYQNGDLRFWIYSSTGNIKVEIERWNGETVTKYLSDYGWNDSYVNTWRLFSIPLDDFAVDITTSVKSPFKITVLTTPATFYIDMVRWAVNIDTGSFNLKIKRISDDVEVSSFTFTRVNLIGLPTGWVVADQYIEIEVEPSDISWGIQIYTDNESPSADPRYTGTEDPAGLVDTSTTTKRLQMGWTIEYLTHSLSELGTGEPGTWVNGGYQWKYFKDKASSDFTNGGSYVTPWNNEGLLWNTWQRDSKSPPNYIYISADFSNAVTPRTYKTKIFVEFYYQ
ncbi:MAG: hypothetical protein DRI36_00100 [Caldiserica bacterium]|nr:MAG: hypothetical protein DRI36_00100 [Caldisericota bacterium]